MGRITSVKIYRIGILSCGLKKNSIICVQSLCKPFGHFFPNGAFIVLHLTDVMRRNTNELCKLPLRQILSYTQTTKNKAAFSILGDFFFFAEGENPTSQVTLHS